MIGIRSVFGLSVLGVAIAVAGPVAAQSTRTEGSRVLITVEQISPAEAQVLTVPEFGPLITGEATGGASSGVLLDATGGGRGVILDYPTAGAAPVGTPSVVMADPAPRPDPRPEPRPAGLGVADAPIAEPDEVPDEVVVILVDAESSGPRPSQRPREVAEAEPDARITPVEDAVTADSAVDEVVITAAVVPRPTPVPAPEPELEPARGLDPAPAPPTIEPAPAVSDIELALTPSVIEPTTTPSDVALAPTPSATEIVDGIVSRAPTASRSAVLLPDPFSGARPDVQPAAFAVPRQDRAPVAPGLQSGGPAVQEGMDTPQAPAFVTVSAALMPGVSIPPSRVEPVAFTTLPTPDPFPYFALPRGSLPAGPDAQDRATRTPAPVSEPMAAVLLGEPRRAPVQLAPLSLPDMPLTGEPPRDPEGEPDLPRPDATALARLVTEAEICWQYADLAADASWASLSVEVALDEMNMPAAQSIRLTGFANVMSSSASEAYHAARGALIACAEATQAEPATAAATLVFDREGVRLR